MDGTVSIDAFSFGTKAETLEYLYQNSRLQLDELMNKLVTDAADTKVKVTDENASKRAYKNLIAALEDKNIHYINADV